MGHPIVAESEISERGRRRRRRRRRRFEVPRPGATRPDKNLVEIVL
jgi:hypothetical protein